MSEQLPQEQKACEHWVRCENGMLTYSPDLKSDGECYEGCCDYREAVLNRAADEIEQLRDLLRECLHAWEGSGPAIVLDRIRAVTQEPPK